MKFLKPYQRSVALEVITTTLACYICLYNY
jgi:hypothetical protein